MRFLTQLSIAALILVGSSRMCEAAFLDYLSGSNSTVVDGFGRQGKMVFAVYDNPEGSDWKFDLFGGVDPDAEFGLGFTGAERSVFFFQYERLDSSSAVSDSMVFPQGIDPYATAGYYTDFNITGTFTTNTDSRVPAEELLTGIGFTEFIGTTVDPNFVGVSGGNVSTQFVAPALQGGGKTSLLVMTSFADIAVYPRHPDDHYSWDLAYKSMTVDGTVISVPVPNPEPSSLALLGFGMLGIASTRRRRRNRVATAPRH